VYDESKGGFIPAQPFSSWTWDSTNKGWKPPVDAPQPPVWAGDDPTSDETTAIKKSYTWDEDAYQADTNDPKTAIFLRFDSSGTDKSNTQKMIKIMRLMYENKYEGRDDVLGLAMDLGVDYTNNYSGFEQVKY